MYPDGDVNVIFNPLKMFQNRNMCKAVLLILWPIRV